MAYKRIIATLTVKNGQLVKSYGYNFWRPAGNINTALKNLDRWRVDEIVVVDISRSDSIDINLLNQIRGANISTPLIYGGGIRRVEDLKKIFDSGVDRILIESALDDPNLVRALADKVGSQAIDICLRYSE
jgi:cyclase